jgi:hypothetical protein
MMIRPTELELDEPLVEQTHHNPYNGFWILCCDKPDDELRFKATELLRYGKLNDVLTITCVLEKDNPWPSSNTTHWTIMFNPKPNLKITPIVDILKLSVHWSYTDSHRFIVHEDAVQGDKLWRKWDVDTSKTISRLNNTDYMVTLNKPIKHAR